MMGKYKAYEKYKDSGILWLGKIPAHWEVRKLKYLADCLPSNVDKHSRDNEKVVRLCNYTDVYKNDYINDAMNLMIATASDEQIAKLTLKPNDIIITKDSETANDIAVPVFVKEPLTNVVCGYHLTLIRPKEEIYPKFLFRLFQHKLFNSQFEVASNGITRVGLGVYDTINVFCVLPTPSEQTAIARFLDYKLAKINRFIRKKKQLIKLLNEQKAAIINQAVTRGLDPHAPMKESGIEWLGEMPAHWEVRKLKYSVNLNQNKSFSSPESASVKIALENIESKTGRILELYTNTFDGIGTIFKKGDVLFGKLRPYLAKAATPHFEGSCVNEILVLTPNKEVWHSEFLKYRILASDFISLVDNSTYGAKMPRASWDFIGSLKISRPSIDEQLAIVNWIEEEHKSLNVIIAKIEKEIALVEEYKTALIAEAVTGKIDVRGYEVPELESEEQMEEELEDDGSMEEEGNAEYQTENAE